MRYLHASVHGFNGENEYLIRIDLPEDFLKRYADAKQMLKGTDLRSITWDAPSAYTICTDMDYNSKDVKWLTVVATMEDLCPIECYIDDEPIFHYNNHYWEMTHSGLNYNFTYTADYFEDVMFFEIPPEEIQKIYLGVKV